MGVVNFDTNVVKDVDIDVDIDLDIVKNVSSFVDIVGNLATAEASADAFGSGGGTGGTPGDTVTFLLDGFADDQFIQVFGTNVDADTVALTDTSLVGAFRTATLDNTATGDDNSSWDSGLTGAEGTGIFDIGNNSVADLVLEYTGFTDADFTAGGFVDSLVIEGDADFPSTDPDSQFTISLTLDDGQDSYTATRNVSESDANAAGEFTVEFEYAEFIGAGVDMDSIDFAALHIEEEQSYDIEIDFVEGTGVIPGGGGTLAETETFAQAVEGVLSQSFSMSTAAAGGAGTGDDMIEPIG